MTTTSSTRHGRSDSSVLAGNLTVVLGALFVFSTAFAYALSLSDTFNPPDWVRVVGLLGLPLGFFATPLAYLVARTGSGRDRGRLGLAFAATALAAFVVLLVVAG